MPLLIMIVVILIIAVTKFINKKKYRELESKVLNELNFSSWDIVPYFDEEVIVKSRQALEKYDDVKFFKENKEKLLSAKDIIKRKNEVSNKISAFLDNNEYNEHSQYKKLLNKIKGLQENARFYRICVIYITYAGNELDDKEIILTQQHIEKFDLNPSLLMGKGEYNKYLKEQQKEALNQKRHEYYEYINKLIDFANKNRESLFVKDSVGQLDNLIAQLFDRAINSVKKVNDVNSGEWDIIQTFIKQIEKEINAIVNKT